MLADASERVQSGISSAGNYLQNFLNERVTPGTSFATRAAKVFNATVGLVNHFTRKKNLTDAVKVLSNVSAGISFIETVQVLFFWINPINLTKVDEQKFKKAIYKSLSQRIVSVKERDALSEKLARQVLESGKNCYSKRAIKKLLVQEMVKNQIPEFQAKEIVKEVKITKKARSTAKKVSATFRTIGCTSLNIRVLDSWKVINLTKILNTIVTKVPAFKFLTVFPFAIVLSIMSIVGLSISVADTSKKLYDLCKKLSKQKMLMR